MTAKTNAPPASGLLSLALGVSCYFTYSALWGRAPGWVLVPALTGLLLTSILLVRRSRWFQRFRASR
jgi:hypothetical protein